MKTYSIKYETYSGNVYTVAKAGYSQQHAENQLINCKEIYWTKLINNSTNLLHDQQRAETSSEK